MSYPPPIYPPIPAKTEWPDALLHETYQPIIGISETMTIDNETSTRSSLALSINDTSETSANRTRRVQSNSSWPIISLTYFAEQCSMFTTRPSLRDYIPSGDTGSRNTLDNNISLPALAVEQRHPAPISAETEDESISLETASSILNLAPIDDSPVPSPPLSPHISSSQSSCSELQNSQIQISLSATVLDHAALSLTSDIPEPYSTNNLESSSSPPNSSPARIFSSSPFVSSQSSLPTFDEPGKDVPTKHQQPTLVDEDQAHTPQFSPPQITPSSPTLPSSSPQASLEIFHSRSYSPEHKPAPVPLKNKSKLEALRDEQADEQLVGPKPSLKRPRSLIQVESQEMETPESHLLNSGVAEKEKLTPAKRVVGSDTFKSPTIPPPPAQKRSTFVSQKLQHKKLATPFRSPLMKKTISSESNAPTSPKSAEFDMQLLNLQPQSKPSKQSPNPLSTMPPPAPIPVKKPKKFTPKAASQFKSPLSGPTPTALTSIRLTPTIQTLERKVQILKRAVKVQADGEEEVLERLVKKWTEAGRDVAWEVWGLVKDSGGNGGSAGASSGGWGEEKKGGTKRGFEEGWGWDDKDAKKTKVDDGFERNWGWNTEREEDREAARSGYGDGEYDVGRMKNGMCKGEECEEEDKKEDTLGTMLRQLGIAPETFGWNDDGGEFVGE